MAKTTVDKVLDKPDYTSPLSIGDFRIRELSLHSPSNDGVLELDSPSVFVELNIYEDLFSNVLKGTLTFLDTQGWAESVPLIGDETLILSYSTPGGEGTQVATNTTTRESQTASEEAVRQRFKVYDCVEASGGERGKLITLMFVSEEYVFSSKMKVSKGYKGRQYSFAVKDVMNKINKNMRSDLKKNVYIEETATPQNFIIPNWNPFQAINFCASRSLSADATAQDQEGENVNPSPRPLGSLFVFYEKLGTGFFYESIESMIIKQKSLTELPLFKYGPKLVDGMKEQSGYLGYAYSAVENFDIKSSFKTLESLKHGMFGSRLIAYDPIRMKYDEVKFDYYEKKNATTQRVNDQTGVTEETTNPDDKDDSQRRFADFIATDVNPKDKKQNKLISTNSDFVGSNEASVKLATTTRSHDEMFSPVKDVATVNTTSNTTKTTTSIGVSATTFKDTESKPNRVEDWLLQRQMQVHEFGSIVVAFTISGNSSRHVGDLVRFEIPSTIPDDDPEYMGAQIGHQLYSGLYLISKIRHILRKDGHIMDVELIKNSFSKRIPGQVTEEATE
jgi:hypothetical protein